MSDTKVSTSPVTIAVAPTTGSTGGGAKRGGHHYAYKACRTFGLSEPIRLVSTVNPWRPGTAGHEFYVAALEGGKSSTIGQAIELGMAGTGQKARELHKHLRWLYTWGGSYLEVSGQLYAAPQAVAPAPVAPAPAATPAKVVDLKPAKAQAKAPGKASGKAKAKAKV